MSAVSAGAERVLIYYGDVPLLAAEDLVPVVTALGDAPGLALATCEVAEPFGYGRVLRDEHGEVVEIREQRDLRDDRERAVREINPGIYAAGVALVRAGLASLQPNNAQGELYLTDLVAYARGAGGRITGVRSRGEVLGGVNDRQQLAEADQAMVERIARKWRVAGVTVRAGARIEAGVTIDLDATIETGACLRGATRIGRGAVIDVGCVLTNVEVAEGVVMKPYTVASDSRVGPRAQLGPFSHLRPESDIGEDAHVGNFVETKKTRDGQGGEGEPPRVPRRRNHRRWREHRGRGRFSATTTASRSTDDDRGGGVHRERFAARRACARGGRGLRGDGNDGHARCARERARALGA